MRDLLIILSAALMTAVTPGCARHTVPLGPGEELTTEEKNFEAVWVAARKVLKRYRFDLDREDRRSGVIVTRPMTGKVAGEFWRDDAATDRDLAESTLHTIYRQAKVMITPEGPGKTDFRAKVEVRTYRSNRPQAQITSVSDAFDLFKLPGSDSKKRKLLEYEPGEKPTSMSPLGRDEDLEALIASEVRAATPEVRVRL